MHANEEFKLQEVLDDCFLIAAGEKNYDYSKLVGLNETSKFLWLRMIESDFTITDLVDALTKEYDIDEDTARTDVTNLINQFLKEGIVLAGAEDEGLE